MSTCPFGWWLNTTLMWTSTTCGPGPRSHCRGSCPSIASNAAILHVLLQNGAGINGGAEAQRGTVRRANIELELAACGHPSERPHVETEVRRLAPRSNRSVWLVPQIRALQYRKTERSIIEDQGGGARCLENGRRPPGIS